MSTTPKQNVILLRLALFGPTKKSELIPREEREGLNQAGWIEGVKQGRATFFNLTDKGWGGLDGFESIRLPASKAAAPLLEKLFALVGKCFHDRGESLASLHLADGPHLARAGEESAAVPERIRQAYLKLSAASPGCEVRLKHLRTELTGVDPETLNLCLLGLVMAGQADLRQIDDPLALDEEDRSAAINLGGTTRHLFRSLS